MSMTSYIGRVRIFQTPRPDVPDNWIVMNAPRPLYGHKTHLQPGPEGMFTVAIDPSEADAAWMIKENRGLDACTVIYLSPELLLQIGLAHYMAKARTEAQIGLIARHATEAAGLATLQDSAITTHGWDVLTGALNPTSER
jgi:hypothetical protein